MSLPAAFRQVLLDGDAAGLRVLWNERWFPADPLASDAAAEIVLHRARTESAAMPLPRRAWSHRWLLERGLPSGLPDALRPRAERLYPRQVETVGVIVATLSPGLQPVADALERAMSDAVAEVYADAGPHPDPNAVRARMAAARARVERQLLGRMETA